MSLAGNLSVIISEVVLSLYPILVKVVPTNFDTGLLSRFAVFTAATLLFYTGQKIEIGKSLLYGLVTIFHVVMSYTAFSNLSSGTAMALFYTYPIMNVIAGILFLGESISPHAVLFLLLGFVGTVLISQEIPTEEVKGEKLIEVPQHIAMWTGLLAAFSETLMYLVIRDTNTTNPIDSMLKLYPGALAIFAAYLLLWQRPIDTNPVNLTKLGLFNLIVGFGGYYLRTYGITMVSTVVFSLLSFIGVLSSYLFGSVFVGETSSWKTYLGALLIAAASSGITMI
jgi:drug/metabolite transporter (DMT)-like permease